MVVTLEQCTMYNLVTIRWSLERSIFLWIGRGNGGNMTRALMNVAWTAANDLSPCATGRATHEFTTSLSLDPTSAQPESLPTCNGYQRVLPVVLATNERDKSKLDAAGTTRLPTPSDIDTRNPKCRRCPAKATSRNDHANPMSSDYTRFRIPQKTHASPDFLTVPCKKQGDQHAFRARFQMTISAGPRA